PIDRFACVLRERRLLDDAGTEEVRRRAEERFQKAVEDARRQPKPTHEDLTEDVLAPSNDATARSELKTATGAGRTLGIAQALREGLAEEMRRDPSVFC